MGRVSEGRGMGKDFYTLKKPLTLAEVRGIYKNKNIYKKYMRFQFELFVFSISDSILHIMRVLLTHFII